MIKIKIQASHLSFEMEEEEFFPLGYKVLAKQPITNAVRGVNVRYNGRIKLLYSVENLQPVEKIAGQLSETEKIQLIIDLLEVIRKTAENGFLPGESVVVNRECLFWNGDKKAVQVIVLPISRETAFEDKMTWVARLRESLMYLGQFLAANKQESLKDSLINLDTAPAKLSLVIQELKRMQSQNAGSAMVGHYTGEVPMQIVLYGISDHGGTCITVDKPEFVLGKKQGSVDGYIGMSTSVSRMHCKLLIQQGKYYCMDLGSLNHTYVNNVMIASGEKYELHDKDILKLADVELQVRLVANGGYR